MDSSIVPKVRYVRCPKCRQVLPEPVDVPFYRCGGCETILRAKHYEKPNERREMDSEASSTIQNNEVQNVAQGGEASSSNPVLLTGSKEGINAVDGNLEQASSSNQPKPAAPSSPQGLLQQDEEAEQDIQDTDCLREGSSSNEPSSSIHEVASNRVPETGESEGGCICAEQRGVSSVSSSNESVEELEQLVSEDGEVGKDEIVVVEERLEAEDSRSEAASADAKTDGEEDELKKSVSLSCRLEQPGVTDFTLLSNEPSLSGSSNLSQVVAEVGSCTEVKDDPELIELVMSNEPIEGGDELCSHSGSLNEEVMMTDGYCSTPASPNKSTCPQNKELPQLNQDIVHGGSLNDTVTSIEDSLETPPAELDPKVSDVLLPEPGKTSTLSTPDEYANSESQNSVIVDAPADGNKSAPSLPALNPTVEEEEVLDLDDRSQKAAEIKPREEKKVTETVELGISCKDLPKSLTRKCFGGSVSSCDGNGDQMVQQQLSETIQGIKRTEIPAAAEDRKQFLPGSGSTFQHKMANLHPMLTEIKLPEVMSDDAPYRRSRGRREFAPRVPVYKTSPETLHESRDHLAHKDFYDRPMYYPPPPYRYRDVESRFTRERVHRSDVDGRMISEDVWTGEEFHHHMYPPYHESSGELHSYPRHQMHYHGRRQTEYRPPLVHRPHSGETLRSGYRVVDSYSHLHPSEVRRGPYGPTEPYQSYYTDSDYYVRSRETFSGDQRHAMGRLKSGRNAQPVQHLQPIGGAAPFITCYQCSELLQLPSDFLVIKGIKFHRLKCSACSTILKFSLERNCHLVPYVPKPASEALHRRSASASSSSARSDQRASLRSSSEAPERQKSEKLNDKGKNVMHSHNNSAAGSSSSPDMVPRNAKVTWRLPDRNNSPLHRLMGYSSPSAVLYGYGSGSDDFEAHSQSR